MSTTTPVSILFNVLAYLFPLTSNIVLPSCLLMSSLSTSCVSSTSPHILVCHLTSTVDASVASSIPNLDWLSLCRFRKCSLHSINSLAPTKRLFAAITARSNPASSYAGRPDIQPRMMLVVASDCLFGMMLYSLRTGLISTPGQTLVLR